MAASSRPPASGSRSTSRSATVSSMRSTPGARSSWTRSSTLSCQKRTSWPSSRTARSSSEHPKEPAYGLAFLFLPPPLWGRVGVGGCWFQPRDHRQGQHCLGHRRVLLLAPPVVVRVSPAHVASVVDQEE